MPSLLPNAFQYFSDLNGRPLVGGAVYFYYPNTDNKKDTYQDQALTIPNSNPVIIDSRGNIEAWGNGSYRQVVYDVNGVLIWDRITQDNSNPLSGNYTVDVFVPGDGTGNTFVPGTTTTLNLSKTPGSASNIEVFFDPLYQQGDQIQSLVGNVLTFVSPIPVGVSRIEVRSGSTSPIATPAAGSVGDSQIAPGSNVAIIVNNTWTLKRFGAKMDGVTDDTKSVLLAFHSGEKLIQGDAGNCLISGTIDIPVDGFAFVGAGRGQTKFIVKNANLPAIKVADSLTGVKLDGFSISRSTIATAGGDGIQWTGSNSQAAISNVFVEKCFNGFLLGSTDFSRIQGCISQSNQNDGFQFLQSIGGGSLQWNTGILLSQFNGRHGYAALAQGTAGGLSCGTFDGLNGFGNSGAGFIAIGSASNPMSGVRLSNFFLGQDGLEEIYLSTYSGEHIISGGFTELCGTGTTGPGLTTPATNSGNGIYIDYNNFDVHIIGGVHAAHSQNGILSSGAMTILTGVSGINNGLALTSGQRNGVYSAQGRMIIQGGCFGNVQGATAQSNGIFVTNGPDLSIGGCPYLPANANAPVAAGGNFSGIGYPTNYAT